MEEEEAYSISTVASPSAVAVEVDAFQEQVEVP